MECTWKGCEKLATNPQIGKDGKQWANLCPGHNRDLEDAISKGPIPRMMSYYVKASGGAEAMCKPRPTSVEAVERE